MREDIFVSRYQEYLEMEKEHPEWFSFDPEHFSAQSSTRIKSPAWNGNEGIDIYTNMLNQEYKKK